MFKFSVRGQRVGRIAFGIALLAGVSVMAHRLLTTRYPEVAPVILVPWAAAFAAYAIFGLLGSRRPLEHAGELAVPGLVVPSIGVALLLPLTLHLLVGYALTGELDWFDEWAQLSGFITGPTHLALAVLVGWRARQLATGVKAMTTGRIFWVCLGVSCVPFGFLYMIPPFLVAITGGPITVLIQLMEPLAARDRERAAATALPIAIAARRA